MQNEHWNSLNAIYEAASGNGVSTIYGAWVEGKLVVFSQADVNNFQETGAMNEALKAFMGFSPGVYITGTDANSAFDALKGQTNLQLNIATDGRILLKGGKAKTDFDFSLLEAINSTDVITHLHITDKKSVISQYGDRRWVIIGLNDGSRKLPNGNTETLVYLNWSFVLLDQAGGGLSPGQNVGHEIMESYYSGRYYAGIDVVSSTSDFAQVHSWSAGLDKFYRPSTTKTSDRFLTKPVGIEYYDSYYDIRTYIELFPENK